MKKYAVIVAGGMGMRMGAAVPKQFLLLRERPVVGYTLETFLKAYDDLRIVLVVPAEHRELAEKVIGDLAESTRVEVVIGGSTRFHSVRNGLEFIRKEIGLKLVPKDGVEVVVGAGSDVIVAVHDGVRCLVSLDLIRRCFDQAAKLGSAVPVVDCRDSVRLVDGEGGSKPIDRSRIKMVQTPQTFRGDLLVGAYMVDHQEAFTDEATVVEVSGQMVHLIEGEENNIKITTPEDMVFAEVLLGKA
jgi:2-C-methyl-D-erythritol 4-phosphate cytidylyltransferase